MCNGGLLSRQKEGNLATYNDVDGAREYDAEQNKSEKGTHVISLVRGV